MGIRAKFTRWYVRAGEPGWIWPIAANLLSPSIYMVEKYKKIVNEAIQIKPGMAGMKADIIIVDEPGVTNEAEQEE